MVGRPWKEKVKCLVDDCEKHAVCKGYCMAHYTRLKDYGRLHRVLSDNTGKKCRLDGCERPAQSLGYCKTHYQQKIIYGEKGRTRSRGHPLYSIWHERKVRNVLCDAWLDWTGYHNTRINFYALVDNRDHQNSPSRQ